MFTTAPSMKCTFYVATNADEELKSETDLHLDIEDDNDDDEDDEKMPGCIQVFSRNIKNINIISPLNHTQHDCCLRSSKPTRPSLCWPSLARGRDHGSSVLQMKRNTTQRWLSWPGPPPSSSRWFQVHNDPDHHHHVPSAPPGPWEERKSAGVVRGQSLHVETGVRISLRARKYHHGKEKSSQSFIA